MKLSKIGRKAKITLAVACALGLTAGNVYGVGKYNAGCPKGEKVEIGYESEKGWVNGIYKCVEGTVGDGKHGDTFTRKAGNSAQILAYTEKSGWHYVKGPSDKKRGGGLVPFNSYSQERLVIKEVPDEKPNYAVRDDFAVFKNNTERGLNEVKERVGALEKKVDKLHSHDEKSRDSANIVFGKSQGKNTDGYIIGLRIKGFGLNFNFGKKDDENLRSVAINSPTGRVLEGSVDGINQKYRGISGEYNHDFGGWNLLAGAGLREWTGETRTYEKISEDGNILASSTNSKQNSEKAFTIHAGAGMEIEKFRGEVVAEYDSLLKKIIPGLRVSYEFGRTK